MWINRKDYDAFNAERVAAIKAHTDLAADLARVMGVNAGLIRENTAHTTTLDWARVRINHLERQFAAVLYSKSGGAFELPIPKIESTPHEQANPNMLPDFGHVEDDDPAFKAHPDWFSTGPEPFPLEESKK